jgi:hypothetical protein
MSLNHCRHIKEDGFFCQGPPLHGREYCRFHLRALGRRIRMARERARREPHRLVLPILEDMNAVHVALMQVLDALASGQLEDKRAGLLLYGLQQASTNLRSLTAAPCLVVADEQQEGRAEEYPGFEEEFDLPKDLDLTTPPEVAFPAAAATATAAKAKPSPYRSNPWHRVGPEDVELEEILHTQGEQAYQKRRDELESKSWKQIARERRQVADAHRIVEAARRNEQEWSSAKQKVFYEKLRAEAEAKAKAEAEDLAATRAAAMAAKKSPETASADEEAKAVSEQAGKSGA